MAVKTQVRWIIGAQKKNILPKKLAKKSIEPEA